jgi:hypothetical protein
MGDGGADDASSPPPPGGFSYLAVFHNYPLVAALLGFAIAQSIKFFVTWYASLLARARFPSPLFLPSHASRPRPLCLGLGSGASVVGSACGSVGQSCLFTLFDCSVSWTSETSLRIGPSKLEE